VDLRTAPERDGGVAVVVNVAERESVAPQGRSVDRFCDAACEVKLAGHSLLTIGKVVIPHSGSDGA
jgi:hypothetical protein